MDTEFIGMGVGYVEQSVPIWESPCVLFPKSCGESGSRVHSVSFNVIMCHKLNIRVKMKLLILMFL
jgi:hypothetical protein